MKYHYVLCMVLLISYTSCKKNNETIFAKTQHIKPLIELSTKYTIDPSQSLIYWFGSKLLGSHNGSINFSGGEIYFKENKLTHGEVLVDMNTLRNIDIKGQTDRKELEDHLKGVNFFNVNSFPSAKFTITNVENFPEKDSFSIITGNITIKNITKQLHIKAVISSSRDISMITIPKFKIDRTEFNIISYSKKFIDDWKDGFIDDEIELSMKIIAQNHH